MAAPPDDSRADHPHLRMRAVGTAITDAVAGVVSHADVAPHVGR